MNDDNARLAIFRGQQIRKTLYLDEWWFVINDVIVALTDSKSPRDYLDNMRKRDQAFAKLFGEGGVQTVPPAAKGGGQIDPPLALEFKTAGGKQKLLCWNTEAMFRMIQSIPSLKAEPFKRWLAKVGYERIQEIEDPELATKRTRALYKAKGYSEAWIERRLRGIAIREELTQEWHDRGVTEGKEYSILTSEIAKATFGVTPAGHKKLKKLQRQNLRDHMTSLEQIFSMLGEASTTEITRSEDTRGFQQNQTAARRGGKIAGDARQKLELETGKPVVSPENYLSEPEVQKSNKLKP